MFVHYISAYAEATVPPPSVCLGLETEEFKKAHRSCSDGNILTFLHCISAYVEATVPPPSVCLGLETEDLEAHRLSVLGWEYPNVSSLHFSVRCTTVLLHQLALVT